MKKVYSLILAAIGLMAYTSCTNEVDDVFDKSSAERIQDAIEADKDVLTSAANGWLMEYYCGSQYGGYNVTCKFSDDNTVTVKNEFYDPSESRTSHFKLEQSQGVILSFDEYNEFIHCFSDPVNPFGIGQKSVGMNGDFEFRILTACADSVVMIGKKHGQKIKMTPIADDFDVESYLAAVAQVEKNMEATQYSLVIDENDTIAASKSYRVISFTDPETGNDVKVSFIVTDKGFAFRTPIKFAGKTITGFDYREGDDGWLDPADNSVKIIPIYKWRRIGTGMFVDDCVVSLFGYAPEPYPVEIEESNETPGLYRLVDMFAGVVADFGEDGGHESIEVHAEDPDGVYILQQPIGWDAGYGNMSLLTEGGRYVAANGFDVVKQVRPDLLGTLKDGIITFPTFAYSNGIYQAFINMGGSNYYAGTNGAFEIYLPEALQNAPMSARATQSRAKAASFEKRLNALQGKQVLSEKQLTPLK